MPEAEAKGWRIDTDPAPDACAALLAAAFAREPAVSWICAGSAPVRTHPTGAGPPWARTAGSSLWPSSPRRARPRPPAPARFGQPVPGSAAGHAPSSAPCAT